jgi:hypothetical protein
MKREHEIAMLRRHILQAERHVARQRRIVTTLKSMESDTGVADQVLAGFEAALTHHRAQLARLTAV